MPEALSQYIMRLLAKDPQERPDSAQEVAKRLQSMAESLRPRKEPAKPKQQAEDFAFANKPPLKAKRRSAARRSRVPLLVED